MATSKSENLTEAELLPDEEHPDYVAGSVSEDDFSQYGEYNEHEIDESTGGFTPLPGGPIDLPGRPIPVPVPFPRPVPWPIKWCGPVSGKYTLASTWPPIVPKPDPLPGPFRPPLVPFNLTWVTARVDVDRYYPQRRISLEIGRRFPAQKLHLIAEVTSDVCRGLNHRVVEATITFREGTNGLAPGNRVRFTAKRTSGINYSSYRVEILDGNLVTRNYSMRFVSKYFDPVEIEVDRASNAGTPVAGYNTADHPRRPGNLPNEVLTLETVFERAGFDAKMSPNASVVPVSGAGANSTWSDQEMHNAMVQRWSRFANRAQWAMWVFYAQQHDQGHSLGGIMFDDIGPNHRQGTAIFRDSFIQDVPAGDPDPAGYRRRNEFWTAVHEMGHAFNLAHSWQKSLSMPGGDGPWIPLPNEPEARSFMNYPLRVSGGQSAFWNDFRFRFSDDELVFMRHAPRRFVQMGNEDWFENHGFEAPDNMMSSGRWNLELRPNREGASYRFLEPVSMELKLTNTSNAAASVDEDLLRDGQHFKLFVGRVGGPTRQWRPMATYLHEPHETSLAAGESIYGAHLVSTSTQGWIIDEPGFYKIQAAIDMGDEILVSNVMRVYVGEPASESEAAIADDYFTEDVARAVAFKGAPSLTQAHDTLEKVAKECKDNPASVHAELALTTPDLQSFKYLDIGTGRDDMEIKASRAKLSSASKRQRTVLLKNADMALDTIGHIRYFDHLQMLDETIAEDGGAEEANAVLADSIAQMKSRQVLESVIEDAEKRLKDRTPKAPRKRTAKKRAAKKK